MQSTGRCLPFRFTLLVLVIFAARPAISVAQLQKEPKPSSNFYPLSVAVTDAGEIFLADRNLPGVWKLEGESLTLFYKGSKRFRTPLNAIRCIAVDREGKLLAGDSATRDVYRFADDGGPVGLTQKPPVEPRQSQPDAAPASEAKADDAPADGQAAPGKEQPATADAAENPATGKPTFIFGKIGIPMDIAVDKEGGLFVSDLEIHRIVKVPKEGGEVQEFAQVQAPRGLCLDEEDNLWVISGRRLLKISPAGEKTTVVDDGTFDFPHTVAVGSDQTAYVCDGYAKAVWKVAVGSKPVKLVAGEPLVNPVGMRLVGDKLYVVDPRAQAVFQVTLEGKLTTIPLEPPAP